jgi:peptidyl-prolyl cis-trans isomerase C
MANQQAVVVSTLWLVAATLGCGGKRSEPSSGGVLAKVGDQVITVADLQKQIDAQPPFARARYAAPERKKELLDSLVRTEVMAMEARNRGYDRDPELQRMFQQQMINLLVQKDFEAKIKVDDVPDADAEKYFAEHTAEFQRPDEVRVSQVFAKDRAKAQKAAAELKAAPPEDGRKLRELVAKYSEDEESRQRGGDLGFFDRSTTRFPKPLVEAAFALKTLNDLSGVVHTDKGFVVVKLTQTRPGFSRPFAEAKQQIKTRLFHELRGKRMEAFVQEIRARLKVAVFEDRLKDVKVAGVGGAAGASAAGGGAGSAPASGVGP